MTYKHRESIRLLIIAAYRWQTPMRDDHTLCKAVIEALPALEAVVRSDFTPKQQRVGSLPVEIARLKEQVEKLQLQIASLRGVRHEH